ncbi:hypothetical protein BC332_01998 [Capsicum chinense]|nr:hypothetical protein BC332_01998 [Capsicum chinense]
MLIYGPLSPGERDFIFNLIHIWRVPLTYCSRHSDINLVELGNEAVKEDDRAVLLEGGGLQSTSPRIGSSSVTSHITRFETLYLL